MEATKSLPTNQMEDVFIQSRVTMEKNLASPDKAKREIGISMLCLWLTSQNDIKEEGLFKIWKGLFYCIRHAENATVQTELIDRMGNLLERIDVELSLLVFKAFLRTLRREWGSFDRDCVGGFHILLRHCVFRMFSVLQKGAWRAEVVGKFSNALAERALILEDGVVADKVTLGIVCVFLPGLQHYLPIPADIFEALLEPFWMTLEKGGNKRVAEGISEKVFLPLYDHGCRFLASKQKMLKVEEETACFGSAALSLSISIRKRSSTLLPCASEMNAVQLKLIQEKFTGLERLLIQSNLTYDFIGQNFTGTIDQKESGSNGVVLNSVAADSGASCNISPLQFLVTRTFGRRSKRNQKLTFSPHTFDTVYEEEAVPSLEKPENKHEDLPVQEPDTKRGTMKDYMSSFSHNHEFMEVVKSMDMPSAAHDNDMDGETIDIDGSPHRQEAAISEEDTKQEVANIEAGSPSKQEAAIIQEEDPNGVIVFNEDGISMEDSVISNLTIRFDSIADQSACLQGYSSPKVSTPLGPSPINTGGRKRKSWRCSQMDALDESPTSTKENIVMTEDLCQGQDAASIDNISAKKAKKVHFSLQHNIVWKPSTPLPPQSLRVPPSATPRGSALKKGVLPGPVADSIDTPLLSPKKKKKANPRKVSSAAHSRSAKNVKNATKVTKPVKRGRLSPR